MPIAIIAGVSGETARDRISISDVILDSNNIPIANAAVTVTRDGVSINRQVFTDAQGNFAIGDLPYGDYEIEVRSYNNPSVVTRTYPPIDSSTTIDPYDGSIDNCFLPTSLGNFQPAVISLSREVYYTPDTVLPIYQPAIGGTMFIAESWNKEYDNNGVYFPCPIGVTWGVLNSLSSGQVAYANISLRYPGGPATPQVGLSQPDIILIDPFDYYKHTDDLFYHYKTGVPAPRNFYETGPYVDPSSAGTPAPIYPAGWFYDSTAMQWAIANEFEFGGAIFDHLIKFDKYHIFTSTFESYLVGIPSDIQAHFQTDGPSNGLPYPPQVGDFIYAEDPNSYTISTTTGITTVTVVTRGRCVADEFTWDVSGLMSQAELDAGVNSLSTIYDAHLFSGGATAEADSSLAYTPEIETNIKSILGIVYSNPDIPQPTVNWMVSKYVVEPRLAQLMSHYSITKEKAYESLKRESVFGGTDLKSLHDTSYQNISNTIAKVIASGLDKVYNPPSRRYNGIYGMIVPNITLEGAVEAEILEQENLEGPDLLANQLLSSLASGETADFDKALLEWTNKIQHCLKRGN
jgi:hypothetical protein